MLSIPSTVSLLLVPKVTLGPGQWFWGSEVLESNCLLLKGAEDCVNVTELASV